MINLNKFKNRVKDLKKLKQMKNIMPKRILVLLCIILISTAHVKAQNGLFLRLSVGPGFMKEFSAIKGTGLTLVTKNHAVGWGFNDKYAIYVSEFGGLIKKQYAEYNYINLDAYGLGFTYHAPLNIYASLSGAYGRVSFAHKWSDPGGDIKGEGFGIKFGLDKKWMLSKRWNLGLGPQAFWIKTKNENFSFMNFSLNFFIEFHLTPSQQ
jgi:hypothetical protein